MEVQQFAVEAFTDPVKAMEHFRQNLKDYSLVISDIRMPGISGIELSKEIKKIAPEVKVILMSSFEIPPLEFSKVNVSNITIIDDFMQKPVGLQALLNKVTKQLDHKGEDERGCYKGEDERGCYSGYLSRSRISINIRLCIQRSLCGCGCDTV